MHTSRRDIICLSSLIRRCKAFSLRLFVVSGPVGPPAALQGEGDGAEEEEEFWPQ